MTLFTDTHSTSAFSSALSSKISASLLCRDVLSSQFSLNKAATWITKILWSTSPECLFLLNGGCCQRQLWTFCLCYVFITVRDCDGNHNAACQGLLHPSVSNVDCIWYWEAVLAEKKVAVGQMEVEMEWKLSVSKPIRVASFCLLTLCLFWASSSSPGRKNKMVSLEAFSDVWPFWKITWLSDWRKSQGTGLHSVCP